MLYNKTTTNKTDGVRALVLEREMSYVTSAYAKLGQYSLYLAGHAIITHRFLPKPLSFAFHKNVNQKSNKTSSDDPC